MQPKEATKMRNSQQLRVGLIGCGYQGQWLARAAAEIDAFQLAVCTDPEPNASSAVAAMADNVQIAESAEAVIEAVNVVLIATPHHLLQPYALQAVNAGKHVLAEKPIALNEKEAVELQTAVNRTGVTYMAGYSFRYFPPVAEAKRLISEGVIGEIQTVSAGMPRPGLRSGWVSESSSGGGILGFYGCHMVDRILWFVEDKPVEVMATVRYYPESGVDQTSVFQVHFEKGAIAQFNMCGSSAGWFDFAHVCGREGHLYLRSPTFPNYALTVSSRGQDANTSPQTTRMALDRASAIQQKIVAELNDFAESIRHNRQPPITVEDGRKTLQILDAVIASGRTGKPVRLT
ncbi:MAG: Gfo/Idh/MocA family oxidoreductase [Anaerolineales bacterium]|nr:Gfo/Idh/MocA family oxidoreductase [Anaerolineales bacterium]